MGESGEKGGGGGEEQTLISGDVMTLFGTHSAQQYILSRGHEKISMSFTRSLLLFFFLDLKNL